MNTKKISAVLFDFDGVVMDTESQYSSFWNRQGVKYLGITDFGTLIKGVTLNEIFGKYFSKSIEICDLIAHELESFENHLEYKYIAGFQIFVADLRNHGVKTGLVTSSGRAKMQNVGKLFPEFNAQFDIVLTASDFKHSKPNPECYLLGMVELGSAPNNTFVFEDSFYGLEAAMRSGATVTGLTTTNSYDRIVEKAHYVINDFTGISFEKLMLWRSNRM